jgi:hypothetical protein
MEPTRAATALDVPVAAGADAAEGDAGGVEGNARLTGIVAAVLFFVLAAEAVTLLGVRQMLSVHVFVGVMLIPLVVLKTASTGYRIVRYYSGDPEYRRKGPPHPVLRVTGPFLILTSLALLGSGLALLALGRRVGHEYLWLHKAIFFVWGALIAVHVLGHLRETVTLASADWRERSARRASRTRVRGSNRRMGLVAGALVVGVAVGVLSLGWLGSWQHFVDFGHRFGG